jgi:serine/threonine-protein kinase RsbW
VIATHEQRSIQMSLAARPESVAVARHALAAIAEGMGMDAASIADLKTVVTEACANVVTHAYSKGEAGPIKIEARPGAEGLAVTVSDWGRGIRPRPDVARPSLRMGLSLIAALSDSFEISGGAGRGTTVVMRLPRSRLAV